MAGNPESANQKPGGNAANALTPPTLNLGAGEQTQIASPSNPPSSGNVELTQMGPVTRAGITPGSSPSGPGAVTAAPGAVTASPGALTAAQIGGTPNPGNRTPSRTSSGPALSASGVPSVDGVPLSVEIQDLSEERLLQAAPRMQSHGNTCPALNGIPLLAKIGQGGMGAVYYGIHPRLRSEVAVKVLPFHLAAQDPMMIKRFYREAQIAAQVRSPNLVNVTDVNEEAGLFFLVMEYVHGKTAGGLLKATADKAQPGLPELDALEICISATEGLNAAHVQGVVHRDIKPDNIMIPQVTAKNKEKSFDLRRSKLMDLGLARNEDSGGQSLTGVQTAMGTPGYMAPEQAIDAKTADKRSDVFSMGATLYALMTGTHPFVRDVTMRVLMATMHEPHEPLKKLRPEVLDATNDVINKCLDKKQENRYADAQELLRALKNCRKLAMNKTQIGGSAEMLDDDDGKTFVYKGADNAKAGKGKAGDPGSQATLPAGVAPVGGAAGKPKSKGTLLIAAGVVALLVVGGGAYMATRKPADTVITGGGDINKIQPAKIEDVHDDPDALSDFKADLDTADKKKTIDSQKVRFWVDEARKLKIHDAKLLKRAEGIDKWIEAQSLIAGADELEQASKYEGALAKYQAAASKLSSDDAELKATLRDKADRLDSLITARKNVDIAKGLADSKMAEKIKLIKEAAKTLTDDTEVTNLVQVWQEKYNKQQADDLMKKSNEAELAGNIQKAIDFANDAKAADPSITNEANAKIRSMGQKLSDAEKGQETKRLNEKFKDSVKQAQKYYDEKSFTAASEMMKSAVAILRSPDDMNEEARDLSKKIDGALLALQKAEEDKINRGKFKLLADDANKLVAQNAFEKARAKLTDMRGLFPEDPDIKKIEALITTGQETQKARVSYDDLVGKANKALANEKIDDADKFITGALEIVSNGSEAVRTQTDKGSEALSLQKMVTEKRQKILSEAKDKQKQFNKYFAEAGEHENAGDSNKIEWSPDRVTEYMAAKAAYDTARTFVADPKVEDKQSALKSKLTAAKAAVEAKKQDFKKKLAAADSLAEDGDFEGAASALALLKDGYEDATLVEHSASYDKLKADAEKSIRTSVELVKTSIKNGQLSEAITQAKKANNKYGKRAEVAALYKGLLALQTYNQKIAATIEDATRKLSELDRKLGGRAGAREKRELVVIQRDGLGRLPSKALSNFASSSMKDADDVIAQLQPEQRGYTGKLEVALTDLENLANTPLPRPPPDTRSDTHQEARPPKAAPQVGEVDPFSQ